MADLDPIERKLVQELERTAAANQSWAEKLAMADATGKERFLDHVRRTQVHGATTVRPAQGANQNWLLTFRRLVLRIALPATAVLVFGLILWSSLAPRGMDFRAESGVRPGDPDSKVTLPEKIRVDVMKQRIEFFGGGDKLAGSMTELTAESSPDVQAYQVTVKGKDAKGLEGTFEGRALFTRTVTGAPIRLKADVKRIEVQGDLRISGVGSFQVRREYVP